MDFSVRRKWKKYGRYIYYSGLLSYFVFLTFLTSFALLSPNASVHLNQTGKDFCINELSKITDEKLHQKYISSNPRSVWLNISQYGIIILSSVQLLLELLQFVRVRKDSWNLKKYIKLTHYLIVPYIFIDHRLDIDIFNGQIYLIGLFTHWQSYWWLMLTLTPAKLESGL